MPSFEAEMTKKARQTSCVGFWNKWNGKQKHKNFSWHITQKSCLGTTKVRHIARFMALLRFQSFQLSTKRRVHIQPNINHQTDTQHWSHQRIEKEKTCHQVWSLYRTSVSTMRTHIILLKIKSQPTGGLRLEHHCLRLVDEVLFIQFQAILQDKHVLPYHIDTGCTLGSEQEFETSETMFKKLAAQRLALSKPYPEPPRRWYEMGMSPGRLGAAAHGMGFEVERYI